MSVRIFVTLLIVLSLAPDVRGDRLSVPFHLDRQKLPFGCGSCHVGFDFRSGGGQDGCLLCHGSLLRRKTGLIKGNVDLKDIENELKKTYRHPIVESRGIHSSKEVLPETNPRAARHSDCVDCHSPHLVSATNRIAVSRGKRSLVMSKDLISDFPLCYLCHSDSANLPAKSRNKRIEFSISNPSFHPVEGEGRNLAVVSLLKPYKERKVMTTDVSIIKCGDCHGSDDPNSPSGPHASINQYILKDNYSLRHNESESIVSYALCYRCHNRSSILSNESFKYHALHIQGGKVVGSVPYNGTSCHTCHSSHGSTENKYLLHFNPDIVTASSSGLFKFKEKGAGAFRGECYLTCHGVDHNPKSY